MQDLPESPKIDDPLAFAASLSRDFAASLDIEQTTRRVLGEIVRALSAQAGALFLYDKGEENLICQASVGPVSIEGMQVPKGKGIVGQAIAEDRTITTHNAYDEHRFFAHADKDSGFTTASLLCAPVRVGDKTIGAVEILNKLDGRPFDDQDTALLKVASAAAGLALNNARITKQLVEQESLKKEIELAGHIQRSLLPKTRMDLPVRGLNRPARQVSGDFYDFFSLPDGKIAFALGDVSGKGMNAALLMAKTASLFRCLGKAMEDPGRLLTILNREICETQTQGMFVTMIAGYYDPKTGQSLVANAGHLPALILDKAGEVTRVNASAPPLGILPEMRFPSEAMDLSQKQILLFTDGLNEWKYQGNDLGIEGVQRIFQTYSKKPLDLRLSGMLKEIGLDRNQAPDDVTLLLLDTALTAQTTEKPSTESDLAGEQSADLRINADPKNLRLVRGLLQAAAKAQGFSEDEIQDLLLAATEAIENVIVHAYRHKPDNEILLSLTILKDGLRLRIRDFAEKVDLANIRPRALDEIRPGGLGTHFIGQVMDKVAYLPLAEGEGNLLEMIKRKKH